MKTQTIITFWGAIYFFLSSANISNAQWAAQTSGTNNELNAVYFTDADTGYAVGGLYYEDAGDLWNFRNVIIKTTNGGVNWSTIASEWNGGHWNIILNSVFFVSPSTGWTVGNGGNYGSYYYSIKKTTDGGLTWVSQSSGTTNPLLSIYFINDLIGFASGKNGTIIKTSDGGNNWTVLNSGTIEDLNSIYFVNSNIGYCAGQNSKILKTIDGGTTWNVLNSGISCSFKSLRFANANVGYIAGDNGIIIKTSDGGSIWSLQITNMADDLNSISLISQDTLYAAGYNGSILKTVDGGNHWITESSINNKKINSIFFVSSTKGWIAGEGPSWNYPDNLITQGLIAKTTNGGVKQPDAITLNAKIFTNNVRMRGTVHPNGLPTQVYFEYGLTNSYGNSIEAVNSPAYSFGEYGTDISGLQLYSTYHFRVKAVNTSGTVYGSDMTFTYINGWSDQESGVSDELQCVQFINDSIGFIVGNKGIILKTENYGTTWTLKNSGTTDYFSSCFFLDQNTGYSSTYSGLIYKTVNGGDSWSLMKSFGYTIYDIYFTSILKGVAVGYSGKIYRTTDGGTTWATIASGVTSSLNSVTFSRISPNYGYIVGDNGKFFVTTNEGLTWTTKTTGTTTNLYSVNTPINTQYGWCFAFSAGANGISKNTYSYGDYFNNGNTGVTQTLNSNYFVNDTLGFTVGNSGTIIKTTNGATNWSSQQINFTNALNSVHFVNLQSGWAVGENGTILHTNTRGCSDVLIVSQPSNSIKCTGQSNTFSVSAAGPSITFKWYKNNAPIPNSNSGNYIISNISQSDTGSYFCVVFNECSADTTVTVTLGVLQTPTANAGPDVSICIGSGTTLNASGGTVYSWSPATGLSATNIFNPVANPTITTTYTVTVSTPDGCSATDNVVVTVKPLGGSFSLSSPLNGLYVNATPAFAWGISSGATFYQLYIDGILKKDNISGTTYTLQSGEALTQGLHTWNIKSNGCTQSNETWSMLVDATPPSSFNLNAPQNNSWTIYTQPALQWTASGDNGSGLWKYQLWIDGTLNRDNISTTATTATPNSSLSNASHTWQVKAIDNVGNVTGSNQQWVVKIDNTPPGLFTLILPAANQFLINASPLFKWRKSIDAGVGVMKYQLFIDNVMNKDDLADTSYTIINSLSYGIHTWYVKAFDSLANFRSCATSSFYIDNASPNPFSLVSPADSAIVPLPTPNLSWQAATDSTGGAGMRKYQLWINGVKNRDSINVAGTTASPANALSQGEYRWFIKAFDNVGNIRQSSQTRIFYVDWEPPTAFTLVSPVNDDTVKIRRPMFKWHSSSDIGSGLLKYELNISGKPIVTVAATDTSVVLPYNLTNGAYTWFVKAFDRAGSFTSSNVHAFIADIPIAISGIFSYNNSQNTALDSVRVYLKLNNVFKDSIKTDDAGNYIFYIKTNGTYSVISQTTKPWGGVNGTDALKIQRYFTGLENITEPVRLQAADVNNSGSINGTDALKVKRRFTGMDTGFDRGDWTFAKAVTGGDTIIINGNDVSQNFYGLCVGDVNGSNVPAPGLKSTTTLVLAYQGLIKVKPGEEFEIPLTVSQALKLSAISLVLNFPADKITFLDIVFPGENPVFNVTGGEFRFAWSNIAPLVIGQGDTLIVLKLKSTSLFSSGEEIRFTLGAESELADEYTNVIDGVTLFLPVIGCLPANSSPGDRSLFADIKIYPNPTKETVHLEFILQTACNLKIELISVFGQRMKSWNFDMQGRGKYLQILDISGFTPGVYFLRIHSGDENLTGPETFKIAISEF